MAVLSLSENDNKENIPPFTSKQSAKCLPAPSSSTTYKRRRVRRPLQDITNLFNSQVDSSPATSLVSLQPICRKRRADAGRDSHMCAQTDGHVLGKSTLLPGLLTLNAAQLRIGGTQAAHQAYWLPLSLGLSVSIGTHVEVYTAQPNNMFCHLNAPLGYKPT
ncbi:hypothetical protein EZV62_026822 [Acer yangbiense]|uniref:Uncharacterized protein n=1 Tax=Acer yangbiense TaxID=1000413 RepID=A0A5C7GS31_9ROSI|nr:hypothetical protein EZV62_026822 [Acer yangbiense]